MGYLGSLYNNILKVARLLTQTMGLIIQESTLPNAPTFIVHFSGYSVSKGLSISIYDTLVMDVFVFNFEEHPISYIKVLESFGTHPACIPFPL